MIVDMARQRRPGRVTVSPADIKRFRLARKLTQGQAAELVGVSRTSWTLWENGRQMPSPVACLLIKALSKTN